MNVNKHLTRVSILLISNLTTVLFPLLAQQVKKPNVILINVDDLGWRDLGFMGSHFYETPHIDQLSTEGIVFTNAYASASNCAPSRASMISGLYNPRHGIYTVSPSARGESRERKLIPIETEKVLQDTLYTMAKMFKANHYSTAIFGKWHLGTDPRKHGFDVNVGGGMEGNPKAGGYFSPYKIKNITAGPKGEYLTDRLTTEAIDFIKAQQGKPFFVYLAFYAVHTPIDPKKEFVERFANKSKPIGQANSKYAAMVYGMDQNVGRILQTLKELSLEENTIVIFTSDNGGLRAISHQDPLRAGKGSYYEGGIRVPLIIKWPAGIPATRHSDQPVINIDLFPTLATCINAKPLGHKLDGADLSAVLKNEKKIERDLFWHFPIYLDPYDPKVDDGRDSLFRTRPGSVIRSGKWKLHEYNEDNEIELYNLDTDIGERNNIANKNPAIVKDLKKKLDKWKLEMNAPVPTLKNPNYKTNH